MTVRKPKSETPSSTVTKSRKKPEPVPQLAPGATILDPEAEAITSYVSTTRSPIPKKLTEADKGSIYYFIREKRDLSLWKDYPEKKHLVEYELPYLWSALKQLGQAERLVNFELRELGVF